MRPKRLTSAEVRDAVRANQLKAGWKTADSGSWVCFCGQLLLLDDDVAMDTGYCEACRRDLREGA